MKRSTMRSAAFAAFSVFALLGIILILPLQAQADWPTPTAETLTTRAPGSGITFSVALGDVAGDNPALPANEAPARQVAAVTVTTLADENGVCDGSCSLREALASAGSGATIDFAPGLANGTILLNNELDIAQDVTISGTVPITISGNNSVRVFDVQANSRVTFDSLTIADGNYSGSDCGSGGATACGGGIMVKSGAQVTVTDSTLSGNSADYRGGGIYNDEGTAIVTHSTLSGNSADFSGGGIYNDEGTATVTHSTLSSNSSTYGGGIFNSSGTATVAHSTLSANSAYYGGGIYTAYGTATVTHSTLSGNSAYGTVARGGGISNVGGTATVTHSTLSGNSADHQGGGIYNSWGTATVTDSTLSGNSATHGGGISNYDGTATVTHSTLSGNSASIGGGIYNSWGTATVTVTASTLSGNSALSGGGGGIYNGVTATVTDSTLSSNSALFGGGIYNNFGTATVTASTLSGNSATDDGGGIFNSNGGTATMAHSIIANSPGGGDCAGSAITSAGGYNLDSDNSCGLNATGDITGTNPLLGVLADNGGPTWTHLPAAGSPVIDQGNPAFVPPPATDQRGATRVLNGRVDIGAVETCGNSTVLNNGDAGLGSLRQAIGAVCPGGLITFDNGLSGSTILLSSELDIAQDVTISGTVPITISGSNSVRVFDVQANSRVTFDSLTIADGNYSGSDCGSLGAAACGGGIMVKSGAQVTVTASTLSGNSATDYGGGIFNSGGTVTVTHSTLSGNSAYSGSGSGGSIYNDGSGGPATATVTHSTLSGNSASSGGGIYNNGGTATVTASTLSGNLASYGGGIYSFGGTATVTVTASTLSGNSADYYGGGIFNSSGTVTVTHSTLSGNSATDYGGGIFNNVLATATVTHSTLSGNSANTGGGGIYNNGGTATVTHSIIANSPVGGDCAGSAITSVGYNLDSDNSCGLNATGDITGTNPLLGVLADNGGPTWTHLPSAGSPVIDQGNPAFVSPPATDQRGVVRVFNGRVDIGAVERMSLQLTITLPVTNTAHLDWNDTAHDGYQLWRSSLPYNGYALLVPYIPSAADQAVDPGQAYFYAVYGVLGGQPAEDSNQVGVFSFALSPGG